MAHPGSIGMELDYEGNDFRPLGVKPTSNRIVGAQLYHESFAFRGDSLSLCEERIRHVLFGVILFIKRRG